MSDLFHYVAVDPSGSRVQGEIVARSRVEAVGLLGRQRLQPLSLREASAKGPQGTSSAVPSTGSGATPGQRGTKDAAPSGAKIANGQLTNTDVISFTEELADLLDAGLQLEPALRIIETKDTGSRIGQASGRIREMVREGTRLSQALPLVSKRFEGLYCSLVAAGEAGGSLGVILRKQVEYLTVMQDLRTKVVQALIYPSFICAAGVVLMFVFMTVLVPQLALLFSRSGKGMPLPTKILISFSGFLGTWWWLLLLVAIVAVIGFSIIISRPEGKAAWHRAKLRLPLVGAVFEANFFAQFAHTLANLTANGIPLLDALRLFNAAITNLYLRGILSRIAERVGEGAALSRTLTHSGFFPSDFTGLVSVGEQTGDLSAALAKVAVRFDKALSLRIQRITALIQPVIIFLMAIMVGLFAYSILAGIYQAISGLRPGK